MNYVSCGCGMYDREGSYHFEQCSDCGAWSCTGCWTRTRRDGRGVCPECLSVKTHTLASGVQIISLSAHPFRFSDGTESEAQHAELVKYFTLQREETPKADVLGMKCNEVKFMLSPEQLETLRGICTVHNNAVIVAPVPMLVALRNSGMRDEFPRVVAMNATKETQRSRPNEKIVDLQNWSY